MMLDKHVRIKHSCYMDWSDEFWERITSEAYDWRAHGRLEDGTYEFGEDRARAAFDEAIAKARAEGRAETQSRVDELELRLMEYEESRGVGE